MNAEQRRKKWISCGWSTKRFRGDGTTPEGQWFLRVSQYDGATVDDCPSNGDGTMNVYTMTRRDARLLAKRINQMLDDTQ